MALKIVVLPAPFGPTRQVMRPCAIVETAILQRVQAAEAMVQPGRLEIRGHSRSPSRPCGRNSMNAISSTP